MLGLRVRRPPTVPGLLLAVAPVKPEHQEVVGAHSNRDGAPDHDHHQHWEQQLCAEVDDQAREAPIGGRETGSAGGGE